MCHNFVSPNSVFCRCFWCVSNGMTLEPALSAALWWIVIISVTKKAAWPKMIRHKMPQALLVLSHVQSAIRFVNRNFSLFPQLLLSFVLINHCWEWEGCWFPISTQMTWEFIWNAWECLSTKIRSCRCYNHSRLFYLWGGWNNTNMYKYNAFWFLQWYVHLRIQKYKNQKLQVLQSEESLLSV